jgi:chromate reductase
MPTPPSDTRRILALPGSLRRDSYNRRLLEAASRIAPPGVQIDVYDALAAVPLFDEDLESSSAGGPDGVRRLRAAVAAADGLLIATPEYNQSLPGVLKNAIDWLSRPAPDEVLAGKPVAIAGVSSGRWGTRLAQAALRQTLAATESQVMPAPMLFVRDAGRLFDAVDGRLHDAATLESLRSLLKAFADWIGALASDPLRDVA